MFKIHPKYSLKSQHQLVIVVSDLNQTTVITTAPKYTSFIKYKENGYLNFSKSTKRHALILKDTKYAQPEVEPWAWAGGVCERWVRVMSVFSCSRRHALSHKITISS